MDLMVLVRSPNLCFFFVFFFLFFFIGPCQSANLVRLGYFSLMPRLYVCMADVPDCPDRNRLCGSCIDAMADFSDIPVFTTKLS